MRILPIRNKRLYTLVAAMTAVICICSGCKNNLDKIPDNNSADIQSDSVATTDNTSLNPFDSGDDFPNANLQDGYGFSILYPEYNSNGNCIVYDGEPIQLEYWIDCEGYVGNETGILLFVNGMLQPYSVNDGEETYMYVHKIQANKNATVPISFTPVCGKAGETLSLRCVIVDSATTRPTAPNFLFGFAYDTFDLCPYNLKMKQDSPNSKAPSYWLAPPMQNITKAIYESSLLSSAENGKMILPEITELLVCNPESNPESPAPNCIIPQNGAITIQVDLWGGKPGDFLLIPFVNREPVFTKEFPAMVTVTSGLKVFEHHFTIDISALDKEKYKLEEYNTLFFVAVPTGNDMDSMVIDSYPVVLKLAKDCGVENGE